MPRRRPDVVHEYRISLSDFERQRIDEAISTSQANVAIDGVTNLAMAAGTAMAGAGGLLAAGVLMLWKAPQIISMVTNVTNGALDTIVDTILPGTPIEHRRYAQELARRRGEIATNQTTFCTASASTYDEAKCSLNEIAKDQYFADLGAFRAMVKNTYDTGGAAVIYYGLGDINPDFVA